MTDFFSYLRFWRLPPKRRKRVILCGAAFLFVTFMHLFHLNHSQLWFDEWAEWDVSTSPLGEIYGRVIQTFQPPFYNYLMHFWLMLRSTPEWFRLAGAIFGVCAAVFLYRTIRLLCGYRIAAVSVIVLAAMYNWIYAMQECGEYSLMLLCVSAALYFYTVCLREFTYFRAAMFLLACVGAIYSQYGCVFIILPLLAFFYLYVITNRELSPEARIIVTILYLIAAFNAGIPLIRYFLVIQMQENEIGGNQLAFEAEMLRDLLVTPGALVAWLFNMGGDDSIRILKSIFSVVLLAGSVLVAVRARGRGREKLSLVLVWWIAYLGHYMLTKLHIYAMVHAGQSGGFYCRYSYFYMPLLIVFGAILVRELLQALPAIKPARYGAYGILLVFAVLIFAKSFVPLLRNWEKARYKEMVTLWAEHDGYNEITYALGMSRQGFTYYLQRVDGCQPWWNWSRDWKNVDEDLENLPSTFWLADMNSSAGGDYARMYEAAEAAGYEIIVYLDGGHAGRLARCSRE